ncbi:hypothetical protein GCM10010310_78960 [Streptomyces violaceolatus]|uniref:Uncharacterized protein n=1 Tax=Streptomyces violaceolatus TaxID=67378 RepID=A0ABN3TI46_9ACTN
MRGTEGPPWMSSVRFGSFQLTRRRRAPDLTARSGSASPPEAGPCPVKGTHRCGLLLATPPLRSGATGYALAHTPGGLLRTPARRGLVPELLTGTYRTPHLAIVRTRAPSSADFPWYG